MQSIIKTSGVLKSIEKQMLLFGAKWKNIFFIKLNLPSFIVYIKLSLNVGVLLYGKDEFIPK